MPNHPFLVWLAHNNDRDRAIRGAWITATRTDYPKYSFTPRIWTFEQLVSFSLTDVPEVDQAEIESCFSHAWAQYEDWLAGLRLDFKEARAQWMEGS